MWKEVGGLGSMNEGERIRRVGGWREKDGEMAQMLRRLVDYHESESFTFLPTGVFLRIFW